MSKYGITDYGADYYGDGNSSLLIAQPVAQSIDYGKVQISWTTPGGTTWTRMRLVRNLYGFPTTADDGVVLFDLNFGPAATGTLDPAITNYVDQNLPSPRYYYYSLFVEEPVGLVIKWIRVGDVIGQSVADHGYQDYLLSLLPGYLTSADEEVDGQPTTSSTLGRIMALLGFDLARTRDNIDHQLYLRDPDRLYGPMVAGLCDLLGVPFEPEIGYRQNRVLARNAAFLAQNKGTLQGAVSMASALTGYGAVSLGYTNLMLTKQMASFEGSYAPWVLSSGTATLGITTSVTPYDGSYSLQITPTSTSVSIAHVTTSQPANAYGIPVTAGASYTVSGFAEGGGATAQMFLDIVWYDRLGAVISTTSGTDGPSPGGAAWTARSITTGTAPTGAIWAGVVMRFTGLTAATPIEVDSFQFEKNTGASAYQTPRLINIGLISPRINEINNAGFDTDTTGWSITNGTMVQDTATVYNTGQGSAKITPTGGGLTTSASTVFGAVPNDPFTASCQVHPTTTGPFHIEIEWLDHSDLTISSTNSTSVSCTGGAWTRLSLVDITVPSNAARGRFYIVEESGTGGIFYLDDVLGEHTSQVKPYFDLHTNTGDVYYDGATSESRSHLYPNSLTMKNRLLAWLPKYLPYWCDFELTLATPASTDYYEDTYVDLY